MGLLTRELSVQHSRILGALMQPRDDGQEEGVQLTGVRALARAWNGV